MGYSAAGKSMVMSTETADRLASIGRRFGLNLIVLFGSRVRGWAGEGSDLDIGVWLEEGQADRTWKAELWKALADLWDTGQVDLVVLNEANGALSYEIACSGKPLYESRPFLFQKFQVLAMKRYEDMKKISRWNRQYVDAFLKGRKHGAQSPRNPSPVG